MSKFKIVQGDYEKKALDDKFNKSEIIGDVVSNWFEIARDKQTMVFAINRKHARALCEEFVSHGVNAEYLDAHNNDDERSDVIRRFRDGDTQVICQVALYTEGTDIKEIECLVIARPTRSIGLWRQILGRGARPCEGKDSFLVLDHGGNTSRLDFYEEEIDWTLDSRKEKNRAKPKKKEKTLITCDMCSYIFTGNRCPKCGYEIKNWAKRVEAVEAKLIQLKKGPPKKKFTMDEKRHWFGMLEYYRRSKGYASGWTAHKYRELTGVWPRGMDDVALVPPDTACKNWIKHLQIKWAKSKNRKENKGGFNYNKPYWENFNASEKTA